MLYRDTHPRVLRYLNAMVGADAEDVASETWLQVARDLRGFQGDPDGFRGWVATIARHRATDHLRRAQRRPRPARVTPGDLDAWVAGDDTEGMALELVSTDAAIALIARLPTDQAEAVLLRVVMGLDAAAAFGAEHLVPATASQEGQMITSPLAKFLTTKIIALALAVCTTGGIALAATVSMHGSARPGAHGQTGTGGRSPAGGQAGATGGASASATPTPRQVPGPPERQTVRSPASASPWPGTCTRPSPARRGRAVRASRSAALSRRWGTPN